MQGHNTKKQGFVANRTYQQTAKTYHFPQFSPHSQGDVSAYSSGGATAAALQMRLSYSSGAAGHAPSVGGPQPPPNQAQSQLRAPAPQSQQHSTTGGPPQVPPAQHLNHPHPHSTHPTHAQQPHPVLSTGSVGGPGTAALTPAVVAAGVPPGSGPAPPPPPPAPPHELSTATLPAVSTQQLQQGSGANLPVGSTAPTMMFPAQQSHQQPQGQPNSQYYQHGTHMQHSQPQQRQMAVQQQLAGNCVMPMAVYPFGVYPVPTHPYPSVTQHRAPTPQNSYPSQLSSPYLSQQQYITQSYPQQLVCYLNPTQQQMKHQAPQAPPREKKVLAIVNPSTGKNVLDDLNNESTEKTQSTPSPLNSADASARNTPALGSTPPNKDSGNIAAQFAAQVAIAIREPEKGSVVADIVESGIRTNYSSECSPSIVSDSIDSSDKLNNSLGSKDDSVSECVDSNRNISCSAEGSNSTQRHAQHEDMLVHEADMIPQYCDDQMVHSIQNYHTTPPAHIHQHTQVLPNFSAKQRSPVPYLQPQVQPQHIYRPPSQQCGHQQSPPISAYPARDHPLAVPPQSQKQEQVSPVSQSVSSKQSKAKSPSPSLITVDSRQSPDVQELASELHSLPREQASSKFYGNSHAPDQSVQPAKQEYLNAGPQPHHSKHIKSKSPAPTPNTAEMRYPTEMKDYMRADHHQTSVKHPANKPVSPDPDIVDVVQQGYEKTICVQSQQGKPDKSKSPAPVVNVVDTRQATEVQDYNKLELHDSVAKGESTKMLGSGNNSESSKELELDVSVVSASQTQLQHPLQQFHQRQQNLSAGPPAPSALAPNADGKRGKGIVAEEDLPPRDEQRIHKSPPPPVLQPHVSEVARQGPQQSQKLSQQLPSKEVNTDSYVPQVMSSEDKGQINLPPPTKEMEDRELGLSQKENSQLDSEISSSEKGGYEDNKIMQSTPKQISQRNGEGNQANPSGKKQYDRAFLLKLQDNPLSLKKPEHLPDLEIVLDSPNRARPFDPRAAVGKISSSGPDFTPNYVRSAPVGKRLVGRNSQPKPRVIIMSNAKGEGLKVCDNPWKPSSQMSKKNDPDEQVTEEVLRKMRGILNKLTPENFNKLVDSVQVLPISNTNRLKRVIDLIFDKAVDEQSFSSTYAQMCQLLAQMTVSNESESPADKTSLKGLIINKCQVEFEKDSTDELRKDERMKEILAMTDPEKRQDALEQLEEQETRLRKRAVGNVRFIGELYKLKMLTSHIMMRIIGNLLEKTDEESLECLCKLLTTVGKMLHTHAMQTNTKVQEEFESNFKRMEKIVNDRSTSSRVRFLMLDVIDLKKNKWVPRREDAKPKTKAEVHEEVKREELEQQEALAQNQRRDDRERKRSRDNRGLVEDGWSTVPSNRQRPFDSSRLKNSFPREPTVGDSKEVQLRGAGFGSWARGSSGGVEEKPGNRFSPLVEGDRRNVVFSGARLAPGGGSGPRLSGFSKSMPPPSDREGAISAVKKQFAPDQSKSSRSASRESSLSREPSVEVSHPNIDMDETTAEKYSKSIIEEFASTVDVKEAKLCVHEKFPPNKVHLFVRFSLEWVLDQNMNKRKLIGQLYHDLMKMECIDRDQFIEGVKEVVQCTEDYIIDIPQACDYFGEVFAQCLTGEAVTVKQFYDIASHAGSMSQDVFASIISKASTIMTQQEIGELWQSSGLCWKDVLHPGINVEEFLEKWKISFIVDCTRSAQGGALGNSWQPEIVQNELCTLLKRAETKEIVSWIDANIGSRAKSKEFIRALVTALVESVAKTSGDGASICTGEKFEEDLKKKIPLVYYYVDGDEKLELQCIYALQALSVKHQHPRGLLEKCFNIFYDKDVVSDDAFTEWESNQDPAEQDGKGVCVSSVKNFLRWLKETDIDSNQQC